ncbi:hypothetical protein HanIR_Chr17g0880341 [Helianthus annuus]|nr:hypothetical protein HanIR_Chr17g0880341 [Helianthus annuus]
MNMILSNYFVVRCHQGACIFSFLLSSYKLGYVAFASLGLGLRFIGLCINNMGFECFIERLIS